MLKMPYNPYQDALDSLKARSEGIYRPNPGSSLLPRRAPSTTMGGAQSIEEDPSVETYGILKNLEGEQEERRFGAQMAGDNNAAKAYEGLLASTDDQLRRSNLSQASDRMDAQDAASSNQGFAAQQAGFKSPQEGAQYGRDLEKYKIDTPIRTEHAKGEEWRRTAGDVGKIASMLNGRGQSGASTTQPTSPPAKAKVYLDEQGEPVKSASTPQPPLNLRPKPEFRVGMGASGPTFSQVPGRELLANEQKIVDSLTVAHRQTGEVEDMIREGGIAPDETEGQQMPGFLGQLKDVAKAQGKRALYGASFPDPTLTGDPKKAKLYNAVTQLVELAKIQASSGMQNGMRNMEWTKQVQDHLAQGKQPTATMLERLGTMRSEYLKMIEDIYSSRAGNVPQEGQE